MKWLRRDHDAQRVEERVKYSEPVCAGRQAVDPELPEGIGQERRSCPFDYDICTGEISAVHAVDDYTHNLRSAGLGAVRRGRRGVVLGAERRRKNDECDRDAQLKLPDHSDQSANAGSYAVRNIANRELQIIFASSE
jgi:hypothetical protein